MRFPSAGDQFQHNYIEEEKIEIKRISDLSQVVTTINSPEPRWYYDYPDMSAWSPQYTYLTTSIQLNQTGYGIQAQAPRLLIYHQNGQLKCNLELSDSHFAPLVANPEIYQKQLFSTNEKYLLLISKP